MCPNAIPAKQCVAVGRGGELRAEWLAQTDKQSGRRRLVCMHQHENVDRARAERIFKAREFQKADTTKATIEYYAAQQRVRERTQELRRLRLQREAQKEMRSS